MTPVVTLHRYFLWAYKMRVHLAALGKRPEEGEELQRWKIASFTYGGLWLALLYVVVEGWRELKLQDEAIDGLLSSEHVHALRRLRNALFHFQVDYTDDRVAVFFSEDPAPFNWAKSLHAAYDAWFRKELGIGYEH